ncbi:MAG TPA: DUF3471 domain-containing protein [Pyrinomonadaceae bacterium]|jgi:hypothetical protein|nr:DUF3471 domain-containing protein [Pyrinomonadaceae bacterium]
MRNLTIIGALLLASVFNVSAGADVHAAQAQAAAGAKAAAQSKSKPNAEALRKYAGRYELEVGLIPISTLDVTLEGGELWVKPSVVKKRRLLHKRKAVFLDEVEGATYAFNRDDEGRVLSVTFQFEGESYTATRVELPAPSVRGNTTFRLKGHAEASVVVLTGSFNNWNQSQLLFAREGDEWVCRLDLDPGIYTYKFIVDGNWLLDPANPDTQEDEAGNVNNVLEVKAP